mgnify:CR=1 FL=1
MWHRPWGPPAGQPGGWNCSPVCVDECQALAGRCMARNVPVWSVPGPAEFSSYPVQIVILVLCSMGATAHFCRAGALQEGDSVRVYVRGGHSNAPTGARTHTPYVCVCACVCLCVCLCVCVCACVCTAPRTCCSPQSCCTPVASRYASFPCASLMLCDLRGTLSSRLAIRCSDAYVGMRVGAAVAVTEQRGL